MHEDKLGISNNFRLYALDPAPDNTASSLPCGIDRPGLIPGVTCDFSNHVDYDYDDYIFLPENERSDLNQ